MNNKIGFFYEKAGIKSSTRLNSFILLWAFILFNLIYFLNAGAIEMNFILFDFVMLIGIFTPKYLHKLAENGIIK